VVILPGDNEVEAGAFAGAVRDKKATLGIESSVGGGVWARKGAIYPLKGQRVLLRVKEVEGGGVRWYRITPDISQIYNNANLPWEKDAYKWKGFDKIEYSIDELTQFRGHWVISPFDGVSSDESLRVGRGRAGREDVGSFWFQAEIAKDGRIRRSAGIAESDHRGLSPKVFRVSIREGEGYLGYLTSFFNVPGVFGSVTYQSENYIGVDCADVLVAAYGKWKNRPMKKNYNVAMLVSQWKTVKQFGFSGGRADEDVRWGRDVRAGDFIAVRYGGSRQYQHVGALYRDGNGNGVFDGEDVVLHAGPEPLRHGYLRDGNFDGRVAIIRP